MRRFTRFAAASSPADAGPAVRRTNLAASHFFTVARGVGRGRGQGRGLDDPSPPPPPPPPPPPGDVAAVELPIRGHGRGNPPTPAPSVPSLTALTPNEINEDLMSKMPAKINDTSLIRRPVRKMRSHRCPSGKGRVFVKNLDKSMDRIKLQDLFSSFGTIISCKVVASSDGKSKGFGFVQYDSEESVESAIENLNGKKVEDKEIYVAHSIKKRDRVLLSPDAKFTNLYIKNFDFDVTEEQLMEKFSKFGKISSLVILKDSNGTSKGFGFANYENTEDAKKALEEMNGSQLGSKSLYVARAQKRIERSKKYEGANLYVKHIDDAVTDDELLNQFSQFGTIISAKFMRDEKGIKTGFGFVCLSNSDEANKAVIGLNGFSLHGKRLYVVAAQSKEDRRAHSQQVSIIGLHGKRLYVVAAQSKEDRRAHSQQVSIIGLSSSPIALLPSTNAPFFYDGVGVPGSPTALLPSAYPPLFYGGVVPHLSPRQGLVCQLIATKPRWKNGAFSAPARTYQSMSCSMIDSSSRQHERDRGRPNEQAYSQGNQSFSCSVRHANQAGQA